MFEKYARFISRYWIGVLVVWILLPIGLKLVAPRWDKITHDGDFAYLPATLPSVRGEELLEKAFPDMAAKSNVVLVIARPDRELSDEDRAVCGRLAAMFPAGGDSPVSGPVLTPDDAFVGKKLLSADGKAALVVLQLSNEFMAVDNMSFIKQVYARVGEAKRAEWLPAGLQLGVTGSAPVGSDMLSSMEESIKNTELTTILLVMVILLIVYRSPGLVLIPLLSIAVAFVVSIDLIALVAQSAERNHDAVLRFGHWIGRRQLDFQVFTTSKIFIIVVLFGAATDYCLFLIARYREELENGRDAQSALEEALGQTGHALTASAMTTILGLGAMIFADFGKYRSGGPTIALSLIVALLACMTLAPALLRACGRWVFWPFGVGGGAAVEPPAGAAPASAVPRGLMGRFWSWMADLIVGHPGLILAGSFAVLAIPAWHGFGVPITYDMLAELSPKRESVQGMRLLEQHFLIGKTGPIGILAHNLAGSFDSSEEWAKISDLTEELSDFDYVDSQGKATRPIREVSSLTNPLGERSSKRKLRLWHNQHLSGLEIAQRAAILAKSRKYFLSSGEHEGEVARFELVCDYAPFSQESMRLLGAIDHWLEEKSKPNNAEWHDVEFDYIGVTAGMRDLDQVNQSDTHWIGAYVGLAVLIVLLLLLRRPLVSLYLIFTVVFGYLVSLGLTHLFFSWYYGATYQGLDWRLKIFLFVILVAVGEDYNIYLVTRVFEEQRRRGALAGLREAVVRTGGIITSCGVIMAGTFGSMATGTLRSMIELGFAMSLGVLLDTFIIRTILVPAFLALLERWGFHSAADIRGEIALPHYEAPTRDRSRSIK